MTAPASTDFYSPWSVLHHDPHPHLSSFDPSAMTDKPEAKILPFVSGAHSSSEARPVGCDLSLAARETEESAAPNSHAKPMAEQDSTVGLAPSEQVEAHPHSALNSSRVAEQAGEASPSVSPATQSQVQT
ncbi:hypothetical protein [Mesorhizobium wenxiniae]|uniref:hypothetical protein n=1 Tax=Mesorhizobium wenxiniae TaxID=2014805 RepID=UPI001054585B|nr:hypothetical protein [Mesorhizobium wenxiniae]